MKISDFRITDQDKLDDILVRLCEMVIAGQKKDPEKYSWVKINDEGSVEQAIRKTRPPNYNEWRLVTGNFTFKSPSFVKQLIDQITGDSENYELMLDDLLPIAIDLNFEIKTLEVSNFLTLGNKSEEAIFNYYAE